MNLDSREEPADLRNYARQQRHVPPVQLMPEPVGQNRVETGVTENDLHHAFRGGIFAKDGFDLFPDGSEHGFLLDAAPGARDSAVSAQRPLR
jgi:hypothetical protein